MKLGRLPRTFDPRVPHHGTLKAVLKSSGITRPMLQARVDNAAGLPADVGVMLNDSLGCCTCAGWYHYLQLITQASLGYAVNESDAQVLRMYQEVGGYRPGNESTDNGANEQTVLRYLLNRGSPMDDDTRHTIRSFVEVDVENLDDICEVVQEFGACYIGFDCPAGWMEDVGNTVRIWDARSNYGRIEGGHCVIITGFDRADPKNPTLELISWGTRWTMTAAFWRKYVDEAYAIVDYWLVEKTGKTPYGLDLPALDALVSALREPMTAAHVDHGSLEAIKHGVARSPHWPTVEHEVRATSACIACTATARPLTKDRVQVHHVFPFHYVVALGRPDLELDPRNLVCLCETEEGKSAPDHHLLVGHLGNFKLGNLAVRDDANAYLGMTAAAIRADAAWQSETRTGRLKALNEMTDDEKKELRARLDADLPPDRTILARFNITLEN